MNHGSFSLLSQVFVLALLTRCSWCSFTYGGNFHDAAFSLPGWSGPISHFPSQYLMNVPWGGQVCVLHKVHAWRNDASVKKIEKSLCVSSLPVQSLCVTLVSGIIRAKRIIILWLSIVGGLVKTKMQWMATMNGNSTPNRSIPRFSLWIRARLWFSFLFSFGLSLLLTRAHVNTQTHTCLSEQNTKQKRITSPGFKTEGKNNGMHHIRRVICMN